MRHSLYCSNVSRVFFSFFFLMIRRPPRSTLFPLHDALPICRLLEDEKGGACAQLRSRRHHQRKRPFRRNQKRPGRSEEHTSELQSRLHLVCRLLLEKTKQNNASYYTSS